MAENIQDIIEAYREIYQSKVRDFNILSTIHLSENDHTNILCEILNMQINGECPFMASFVKEVLCLDVNTKDLIAKTQVRAIGPKKTGYIDMLIEEKSSQNVRIIVENKVCGAGDRARQLAEYYFTFVDDDTYDAYKELNERGKEYRKEYHIQASTSPNTYLFYLTDSAEREYPRDIHRDWLKAIHYKHISYEDDIYEWIKGKVLPLIQFGRTGDAHNSIILYLRELESVLGTNNLQNNWYLQSKEVKEFISKFILESPQESSHIQEYKYFDEAYEKIRQIKTDKEDAIVISDLMNCVLCYRDNIFGQYSPQGWTIHCAANYITLYPTCWLNKYGGTKSSCIHFAISPWKKGKTRINLNVHNNACKRNITTDKKAFEKAKSNLCSIVEKILNTKDKLYNTNYDDTLSLFEQNGHFYWHVALDMNKLGLVWTPDNREATKKFFEEIISNNAIRKLIQYIEENFK